MLIQHVKRYVDYRHKLGVGFGEGEHTLTLFAHYADKHGDSHVTIGRIRERIGDFTDGQRPAESDTPAHRRWWLTGPGGTVQAQIQLNPERPPRVQSLTLAVPPAAGSPLAATLAAVVTWLNGSDGNDGTDRYWPDSIPVAETTDAGLLARRLRMASVWAGPARLGAYRAGDGAASVAVELVGEHATLTLTLVVDPASGVLRQADMFP